MKKAHAWTKKQALSAKVPNFGRKYLGQPTLLKLIGNINRKKVLELGSGNGYWLEILSKKGAVCTGIELAPKQIELAEERNSSKKIKYILGDITKLEKYNLKTNYYDVILLEHVLLEISSVKKIEKIFNSAYKLLKKGGILIFSGLHPFAPSSNHHNLRVGKKFNYFSSGDIVKAVSKRIDGKEILYKDFHWTLEDILQPILKSGLTLVELLEPRPSIKLAKKYPALSYRRKKPMSFMFKAKK